MDKSAQSISIVTVTYNSSAVLPEMLGSVPFDTAVVIVDNASADISRIAEVVEAHGARLVRSEENLGFGRACNLGAELVDTELILFLNPDAIIADGALKCLVQASIRYPRASAFNPAIANAYGKPVVRRYSHIDPEARRIPRRWPDGDQEVPMLSGAALLVRRQCFETVGGFDPNIFLYHEDDDLCLRLRAQCGPLMFVRDAGVTHPNPKGRSSESGTSIALQKGLHMGYSRVYAALKHGKPMAFELAVLSAVRQFCLIPRLFSSRRRAMSIGYLLGILKAAHLNPSMVSRIRNWFRN